MSKKAKKTIVSVLFALVLIGFFGMLKYFGFISIRLGAIGGYSDRARMHEWDVSLSNFSGTFVKPIFPEIGYLRFTSEAESGTLSVTVKCGKEVVCEKTDIGSGTFLIPVSGRAIVSVKAEDFTGSYNVTSKVELPDTTGNIYLYGEAHADEKILDKELEIWKEYYDLGMRDLFVEDPYYTAQFLNLWMKADDDIIFYDVFCDWEGSQGYSPVVRDFYFRIKTECPETVFHGIDVGHQYDTTGERYLKYLLNNGYTESSEEYILTIENIEQGKKFYKDEDYEYREIQMFNNFVREYETMDGRSIMGIFGSAHTDLDAMNYGTWTVPCLGNALRELYGEKVSSENLYETVYLNNTEAVSVETLTINGKEYTASYFGCMDLTNSLPGYKRRDVWRIEDAYEDFKDVPTTGNVLPYYNYPMSIEDGQVFKVVYTMDSGNTFTEYHRCDGNEWNGNLTTEQMDLQ